MTVLRGITDDGVPGRGRPVRIIVIARVYDAAERSEPAVA